MSLVRRTGLAAGPFLALACHLWLPVRYADARNFALAMLLGVAYASSIGGLGTPSNAIVFGTGLVPMQRMLRAGFWLNLAGIAVITALAWLWFGPMPGASG